jgi:hypothetical protein
MLKSPLHHPFRKRPLTNFIADFQNLSKSAKALLTLLIPAVVTTVTFCATAVNIQSSLRLSKQDIKQQQL